MLLSQIKLVTLLCYTAITVTRYVTSYFKIVICLLSNAAVC